jgi:hypothetical protein
MKKRGIIFVVVFFSLGLLKPTRSSLHGAGITGQRITRIESQHTAKCIKMKQPEDLLTLKKIPELTVKRNGA